MSLQSRINDFLRNKAYNPLNLDSTPAKLRQACDLLEEVVAPPTIRIDGKQVKLPPIDAKWRSVGPVLADPASFKIGDTVRVVRKVLEEPGWVNYWVPSMDFWIGEVAYVTGVSQSGVQLRTAAIDDNHSYCFPPSSLALVANAPPAPVAVTSSAAALHLANLELAKLRWDWPRCFKLQAGFSPCIAPCGDLVCQPAPPAPEDKL